MQELYILNLVVGAAAITVGVLIVAAYAIAESFVKVAK